MKCTALHWKQVLQVRCVCICHATCEPKVKTAITSAEIGITSEILNDKFHPEKEMRFHISL